MQTECKVTQVKAGTKRLAEETEETTQQMLGAELRNVSDGEAANLPSLEKIRKNVYRFCQGRNMPPIPAHRENILDLPHEYNTTTDRDSFLVYNSGVRDKERIFIFASQGAL